MALLLHLRPWEDRVLDAAEVPGAGRGWLARREVRAGELLMSVSRDAATEVVMDEMEGWEAELAVALLRRLDYLGPAADPRLRQSDEMQDLWKDYSRLFPKPVGAAFWPEELLRTLGWPATVEQMLAYSQQIKESAQWVSETADVSLDRACWAVSAVISRSFAVDGQVRAMVPLADIFNHKPASEASRALDNGSGPAVAWSLSEDGERFEVRALENVAPGKEVRICYGEESAAEILAVHGMILPENEADYLEIFESGEDLLAAVETLSGHPRGDRAELMEASLSPDDVLLRPTLEATEPLLRALEVSLCEDEELPVQDVPGEMLLPVCSPERLSALRLQALLFLTQILRGALRAMKDVPETSLGDAGPQQLASRYRGHIKDMLANLISSAEVEISVELGTSHSTTQKQKAALSVSLGWGLIWHDMSFIKLQGAYPKTLGGSGVRRFGKIRKYLYRS